MIVAEIFTYLSLEYFKEVHKKFCAKKVRLQLRNSTKKLSNKIFNETRTSPVLYIFYSR